jgi:Flp pilus assembly protein TadG
MVLPVLILLVMIVLQSALYFHTAHVARAAAAEGAMAAASHLVPGSSVTTTGSERAAAFASEAGGRIENAPVSVLTNGLVLVSVTLEVPSLVPFMSTRVTRDATEPKERVVMEVER